MKKKVIKKLLEAKKLLSEANEIAIDNNILEDTVILQASCDIDEVLGLLGVKLKIDEEEYIRGLKEIFKDDPTVTIKRLD